VRRVGLRGGREQRARQSQLHARPHPSAQHRHLDLRALLPGHHRHGVPHRLAEHVDAVDSLEDVGGLHPTHHGTAAGVDGLDDQLPRLVALQEAPHPRLRLASSADANRHNDVGFGLADVELAVGALIPRDQRDALRRRVAVDVLSADREDSVANLDNARGGGGSALHDLLYAELRVEPQPDPRLRSLRHVGSTLFS